MIFHKKLLRKHTDVTRPTLDSTRKTHGLSRLFVLALAAMTACQITGAIGHMVVPVMAISAAADFGVDAALVGIYAGMLFAGSAFSSLAMAGQVPRIGPIRASQFGMLCNACGLGLILFSEAWLLPASALLVGIGYGPLASASSFLLNRLAPAGALALTMSIKQTGVPIGYGLAGLVLPAIVIAAGWQTAVAAAAVLSLAVLFVLQLLAGSFRDTRGPGHALRLKSVLGPVGLVFRHRGLRRMALASLAFSGIQIALTSFMVVYLHATAGMSLIEAGGILAIANGFAIASRVAWGWIADRINPTVVLGIIAIGMAGTLAALAHVDASWPYQAVAAVGVSAGATVIAWNGVFIAETVHQSPPDKVSEATGGVMFITFSGAVAGPPFLTLLFAATQSYATGFLAMAGVAAGTAVMFLASRDNGRSVRH
jgi:MFS family permease